MPFGETHVVDERRRFVTEVQRSLQSFNAICQRYGISPPTGYKWLRRWEHEGPSALQDRSSRPTNSPWATPRQVVEAILDVRRTHEDYGAKKIIWYLERHRPDLALPSRTTVHNILLRHDLVPKRRKRLRRWHPGRPDTFAELPNDTWSADFKGVSHPRRRAVLPPHRPGHALALRPRLPRTTQRQDRRRLSCLHTALQGVRPPSPHPH